MSANLRCLMFGHVMPKGYAGAPPYLEPRGGVMDGVGREHWQLYARCERCDQRFHVANVHGPLK